MKYGGFGLLILCLSSVGPNL